MSRCSHGLRRTRWVLAGALVAAATAAGCGSSDDNTATAGPATGAATATAPATATQAAGTGIEGKSVYLVASGDVNPWTKTYNHTLLKALEEAGAKTTYLQDPFDPQLQVQNLDRAVAAKPDLILLLALDTRSTLPGVSKAKTAGIDVINLSNPPGPLEPVTVASIESDHVKLGTSAAQNIVDGLKAQGKTKGNVILITGNPGVNQVALRTDAFKKELAKAPGLKIVAEEDGNWDQATSQKIARQLFAKFRDKGGVQAAYGMADNQAIGIIAAAEQAGLPVGGKDGLIVSGSNCYQFGLDAIKAGKMYGTATQSPVEEAEFTADLVKRHLAGEQIPARSYAPESRITQENVDSIPAGTCP